MSDRITIEWYDPVNKRQYRLDFPSYEVEDFKIKYNGSVVFKKNTKIVWHEPKEIKCNHQSNTNPKN
jgi:hypothetical protein